MTRPLLALVSVLLSASFVGALSAQAQAPAGPACGPETWSTDKMAYVAVPCVGGQQTTSTAAANAPAAATCGVETWSTDKMAYVTTPCAAGLTEENPGYKK